MSDEIKNKLNDIKEKLKSLIADIGCKFSNVRYNRTINNHFFQCNLNSWDKKVHYEVSHKENKITLGFHVEDNNIKKKFNNKIESIRNLLENDKFPDCSIEPELDHNKQRLVITPIDSLNNQEIAELMKEFILCTKDKVGEILNNNETSNTQNIVDNTPKTKQPLNQILYGPPGTGKTYNTINKAIQIIDNDFFEENKMNRKLLVNKFNELRKEGRIEFITFHQNYSYEDFIQGIKPDINGKQLSFHRPDGLFKRICDISKLGLTNDRDKNYVIIIDEINRANISRVFGELITLIEEDKRWGNENQMELTLPSGEMFTVPSNLYIIGTMNTADKSIALLDIALRRRFKFIPMYPDYNLIKNDELKEKLKNLNQGIKEQKGTDFMIGHSFFINKTDKDLEILVNNDLLPLVSEYFNNKEKKITEIFKKADINIVSDKNTFQLRYSEYPETSQIQNDE